MNDREEWIRSGDWGTGEAGEYRAEWLGAMLVERLRWRPDAPERRYGGHRIAGPRYLWYRFWLPDRQHVVERYFDETGAPVLTRVPIVGPVDVGDSLCSARSLVLSVWLAGDGRIVVDGESDFDAARRSEQVSPEESEYADRRVRSITGGIAAGRFPPPIVRNWQIDQSRLEEEQRVETVYALEFLGTGGAAPSPRPGCECPVCQEAREPESHSARLGPMLFVHGPDLLFDTPEEARLGLTRAGIHHIGACFYSHWHPDHTMGRRVFEAFFLGARWHRAYHPPGKPIPVYLPPQVAIDFGQRLGLAEHFAFMEAQKWVSVHALQADEVSHFGAYSVSQVQLADPSVYAFLVTRGGHRTLIAMDELIRWQPPESLSGVDVAVLPMGIVEHHPFTGDRLIPEDDPILEVEATFAQTLEMARALHPGQLYLSHVEETFGLTAAELTELQTRLRGSGLPATFAFDGMRVPL